MNPDHPDHVEHLDGSKGPARSGLPVPVPPTGLSKAVTVLLGAVIAADVFSLHGGLAVHGLVGDLIAGRPVTEAEFGQADRLYGLTGVAQVATMLAAGVVFLVWFHRVRVNAEVFVPDGHRKSRGWVVWGWFVPVVNLWFPRRITLDVWNASSPVPLSDPDPERPSRPLVNAWWTLWLLSMSVGNGAGRMYDRAEYAEAIQSALVMLILSDILSIAAAVLAILVVRALTRMQQARILQGPGPLHPASPAS
ncbi:DUF4328 domain-containing protein [Streptomyces sp. TRM 70361]|uniref:DUF4328 domain-containing protein n=1 Tax=Streptomyces sp. TRM 70361 TaxID=3116553 RepID=UPI002E7BF364|nr:DUF4328 domain-containing protein [Streptomyces sp. TRM 70361]MEE1941156.1 DUF4328 domain-containing protein [Streptomyces sp. TRM 70361]